MDELLKNPVFVSHAVAAAGSVTLGTALTYPLDTIKTLIQVGSTSSKALSTIQALDRVRSLSGYMGFYSGFGWSTVGRVAGVGARFGVYEILTAFYKDGREDNYVHVSEALLAGMAAGATECVMNSPFELIKLRSQVTSATHHLKINATDLKPDTSPVISRLLPRFVPRNSELERSVRLLSVLPSSNHPDMSNALRNYPWTLTGSGKSPSVSNVTSPLDIVRLEGSGSLWRGLRSGLVRDSIFGGMFFGCWQFMHLAMVNWKAVEMDPPPISDDEIGPLSPFYVSLAAGVSGAVAAAASHSFDTARTRSQCVVLPRYVSMERRFLKWKRPGKWFERVTGIHPTDRNLLLRGLATRTACSGLASFVIVGSYFLAADHLVAD